MGANRYAEVSTAESGDPNGLTCIPMRIHCAATDDADGGNGELDRVAVDAFLDTLAEVAISVARRMRRNES